MADQKVERDLPSPLGVDFDLPGSKKVNFSIFLMKNSHFLSIFADLQGGPLMPETSSSNKSSKIDLSEGRTQKSATFDLQILDPKTQLGKAFSKPSKFTSFA